MVSSVLGLQRRSVWSVWPCVAQVTVLQMPRPLEQHRLQCCSGIPSNQSNLSYNLQRRQHDGRDAARHSDAAACRVAALLSQYSILQFDAAAAAAQCFEEGAIRVRTWPGVVEISAAPAFPAGALVEAAQYGLATSHRCAS